MKNKLNTIGFYDLDFSINIIKYSDNVNTLFDWENKKFIKDTEFSIDNKNNMINIVDGININNNEVFETISIYFENKIIGIKENIEFFEIILLKIDKIISKEEDYLNGISLKSFYNNDSNIYSLKYIYNLILNIKINWSNIIINGFEILEKIDIILFRIINSNVDDKCQSIKMKFEVFFNLILHLIEILDFKKLILKKLNINNFDKIDIDTIISDILNNIKNL